jgi:hypothetical protein
MPVGGLGDQDMSASLGMEGPLKLLGDSGVGKPAGQKVMAAQGQRDPRHVRNGIGQLAFNRVDVQLQQINRPGVEIEARLPDPLPLVLLCRSRTVAKVDSIGLVVRGWASARPGSRRM